MYIAAEDEGNRTGYLRKDGYAQTAEGYDLAYVYTMPCKAKIDLALSASVAGGTDGVAVYCYINSSANGLIRTVITSTTKQQYSVRAVSYTHLH